MEGVEINKVGHGYTGGVTVLVSVSLYQMTQQPQYSGLATSEESQESLVPHQSQDHLQGPLALHLLVQLDPGEGRGEGHGDTGSTAGPRTSCREEDLTDP